MPRQVLIVEDTELCIATLEIALLKLPGLIVRSARSAEEAWKLMLEEQITALITDIHLPNMDGFELIEKVRANPSLLGIPILVISGDSDPATPGRLESLGANAYFPKPYSPAAVRQKLEQLIYV